MNKVIFTCNACGCKGTIKVDEDHEVECCPSCGQALDLDDDDDLDRDEC